MQSFNKHSWNASWVSGTRVNLADRHLYPLVVYQLGKGVEMGRTLSMMT